MKIIREFYLLPVHFYRHIISPLKGGSVCRYNPSCSTYFLHAVRRFGIIKGTILGIGRILRCSPRYFGGFDPVPDSFSFSYVKNRYIALRKPKNFDKEFESKHHGTNEGE